MGSVSRTEARLRRKKRVRRKVRGSIDRPRLCVFKSLRYIYAQIIDDVTGRSLVSASSLSKGVDENVKSRGGNKEGAAIVGALIAEKALEKGIRQVVFDRNGFLYHGRVKALSEAAREKGLVF